MENEVLANAGVDVFEEVFKLIFSKLYDEIKSCEDYIIIKRILNKEIKKKSGKKYEVQNFITNIVTINY